MSEPRDRLKELQQTVYPSDPYTAVKHAVYQRYGQCWMGKLLQRFPAGAAVVDAFSGSGEYSDGLPGSPMRIAETLTTHTRRAGFSRLDIICLDRRTDRTDHLRGLTEKRPTDRWINFSVLPAGTFQDSIDDLAQRAHAGQRGRPVLWLLDPYGWSDVPIATALQCLNSGQRDEVIISLFTQEMYRFASDRTKQSTFARVFGTEDWAKALVLGNEAASKDGLAALYVEQLQAVGLHAGKFAVAARGHMPRYHLIYATHDERALIDCWNRMTWYMDRYGGQAAGPEELSSQGDLFTDANQDVAELDRLRTLLQSYVGQERSFAELESAAGALGYKTSQLRIALTELGRAGQAVRIDTVTTKSQWPEGSVVRFYSADDTEL